MQAAEEERQATLEDLLLSGRAEDVEAMFDAMHPDELLHEVYVLDPGDQRKLLALLPPERAASLLEAVSDAHAADLIEEMPASTTAPIVEELERIVRIAHARRITEAQPTGPVCSDGQNGNRKQHGRARRASPCH